MPCSTDIYPAYQLIWSRFIGVVTLDQIADANQKLRAETEFDPRFLCINDFRDHLDDPVSFQDMMSLTNEMKTFRHRIGVPLRIGFIAPSDVSFGTARMFATLMSDLDGATIAVERSVDALAAALALDADTTTLLKGDDKITSRE